MTRLAPLLAPFLALLLLLAAPLAAQDAPETAPDAGPTETELTTTEQAVEVTPVAEDAAIAARIASILEATGWFRDVAVRVDDGIAFLDGNTATETRQVWARDLAAKTAGVVAVVNRIQIDTPPVFSVDPARNTLKDLGLRLTRALPSIVLAIVILPLAWFAAGLVRRVASWTLSHRVPSGFLADLMARMIALPVLLLGIYVVLQAAGLTQLALSLVGGAGVLGIVIGFAFRDIAENFLASLLLSIRQPFRRGDFITVAGQQGLVHSMNTRATVLVSPEGNHIQIPNATVFKAIIENFTAAPNRRDQIDLTVGFDAAVSEVQALVLGVLDSQEGVLTHPEPMVLAREIGAASVDLRVFYWFESTATSQLKLKSLLIQRIKQALTDAGIAMPGETREVYFPDGIPGLVPSQPGPPQPAAPPREDTAAAERDLGDEKDKALETQLATPVEGDARGDLLNS